MNNLLVVKIGYHFDYLNPRDDSPEHGGNVHRDPRTRFSSHKICLLPIANKPSIIIQVFDIIMKTERRTVPCRRVLTKIVRYETTIYDLYVPKEKHSEAQSIPSVHTYILVFSITKAFPGLFVYTTSFYEIYYCAELHLVCTFYWNK